jgi:hypothetical protein
MGSIAEHTDLSWEIPGLRADVDLPLDDPRFLFAGLMTRTGAGWHDDRGSGSRDEGAAR